MLDLNKGGIVKKMAGKMDLWNYHDGNYSCWCAVPRRRNSNTVDFHLEQYFEKETPVYIIRVFGNESRKNKVVEMLRDEITFEYPNLFSFSSEKIITIKSHDYNFGIFMWTLGDMRLAAERWEENVGRLEMVKKISDLFWVGLA